MDSAHLNIIYPDGRRSEIMVTKGSFVIGREPGNDLVLDDRAVSRQHARLVQSNSGWKIIDLGSANGTYVEGERLFTLDSRRLQNNTTIRIGGSTLTFQLIPEELADMFRAPAAPEQTDDHAALLAEMASLLADPEPLAPADASPASELVADAQTHNTPPEAVPADALVPVSLLLPAFVDVSLLSNESPTNASALLPTVAAPASDDFGDAMAMLLPRTARPRSSPEQTHAESASDGAAALAALAPAASASSSETWRLIISYSNDHTDAREITANPYAVGRAENNHLRLDDASVAPHHARLTYRGDSWRILDLGSTTGTLVNNERIPPQTTQVLDDGATIQFGDVRLLLRKQVWQLRVKHRSGRQQTIELSSSPFGIGRANDNKLELAENSIANYHAELVHETNGWNILDLGSSEGTYVDGVRLLSQYPQPLNEGSSIQIGETTIGVRLGASVPKPASERPRLTVETFAPAPFEDSSTLPPPELPPVLPNEDAHVPLELVPPTVAEPVAEPARPSWFQRLVVWQAEPLSPPEAPPASERVQRPTASVPPVEAPQLPAASNGHAAEPIASVTFNPVPAPSPRNEVYEAVPIVPVAPVAPIVVNRAPPAAPPANQGQSNYRKVNNIGIVRYWRLRAMRATVVFVGNTVGIYRLQSVFSRTFGFVPRWLVSAGDVDSWNDRLDQIVSKPKAPATPRAPAAPNAPSYTPAPSAQNGTVIIDAPPALPAAPPLNGVATPSNAAALNAQSALVQTELAKLATNAHTQVLISPDQLMVDPGAAVAALITVVNRSTVVDRITINVIGIPEAWTTITPRSFSLFPGTRAEAQFLIRPPRGPNSLAGEHHFAVIGLSDQSPLEHVFAQAVLTITPYAEFRVDLRPQQQAGWRQAAYRLEVVNNGNRAQTYQLQGRDEEDLMDFQFTPAQPVINPGETAYVRLQTRLRRRHWFGPTKTSVFFASSTPLNDVTPAQQTVGRFAQQPIFTLVTLLALVLLLLACLGPVAYRAWTVFFAPLPTPTAQPTAATAPATIVFTPTVALTQAPSPTVELPTANPVTIAPAPITPTLAVATQVITQAASPLVATPAPISVVTPTIALVPTVTPTPRGDVQAVPGTTFTITSTNTPNTAYLVYFDERVISGGSVHADGQIVVELTLGSETPGLHSLIVRERGTSRVLLKKVVYIPETTPTPAL